MNTMNTLTAVLMLAWLYGSICLALDGFGAAWWHWPFLIASAAALIVALLREDLRSRALRASWRGKAPLPIGDDVQFWQGRDPWGSQ